MAASSRAFGKTPEGETVNLIMLRGSGLSANILTWRARWFRICGWDGHDAPLVLGFEQFDHYPAHSPYFGAIAGRYANRIVKARFELVGQVHQFNANFLGIRCMTGPKVSASATGRLPVSARSMRH